MERYEKDREGGKVGHHCIYTSCGPKPQGHGVLVRWLIKYEDMMRLYVHSGIYSSSPTSLFLIMLNLCLPKSP